jgi:hypothetical protein
MLRLVLTALVAIAAYYSLVALAYRYAGQP